MWVECTADLRPLDVEYASNLRTIDVEYASNLRPLDVEYACNLRTTDVVHTPQIRPAYAPRSVYVGAGARVDRLCTSTIRPIYDRKRPTYALYASCIPPACVLCAEGAGSRVDRPCASNIRPTYALCATNTRHRIIVIMHLKVLVLEWIDGVRCTDNPKP